LIGLTYILNTNQKFKGKIIPGISVIIFLENIAQISIGRSGYVALIMMVIIFFWLYPLKLSIPQKIGVVTLSITLIGLLLILTPTSRDRILLAKSQYQTSLTKSEETSIGLRVIFWKNTLEMVPKYWLLGTGTGGFEKAYIEQIKNYQNAEKVPTADPHNQYLKILIEHGILGLTTFLVLLVTLAKQQSLPPYKTIGISTLIAFCITSLTNAHFSTFNEGQFIWIWLGALLVGNSSRSSINKSNIY
jgi:O-antigen ligase